MTAPGLPVTVNIMTTKTESWLILQQKGFTVNTVGIMTGDTVKNGNRFMDNFIIRRRSLFRVTAETENFAAAGQQIRFIGRVYSVTLKTITIFKRLMPESIGPLILDLLVTTLTKIFSLNL
jgi:hypothetical protein